MMLLPLRYVDLLILASKWLLLIQVDLVVKKVFGPNFGAKFRQRAIPTRGNVRQCRRSDAGACRALNFRQTPINHARPAGSRYCTLGGAYDPCDRQNRGGRGTYASEQ